MKRTNTFYTKDDFLTAIKNYAESGIRPKGNVFILKHTPEVYKSIGCEMSPFQISTYIVDKALIGKHKGEISTKNFYKTIEALYDPLLILQSKKDSQSYGKGKIIFTDIIASNSELYAITFYPNEKDNYNGKEKNIITSIHKRNVIAKNGRNVIAEEIYNGNCEYANLMKLEMLEKSTDKIGWSSYFATLHQSINNKKEVNHTVSYIGSMLFRNTNDPLTSIKSIPNIQRVVNSKNEKILTKSQNLRFLKETLEETMKKTDLNSYLNNEVANINTESKLSELLLTSLITDRLNQMGIKTYVIDDEKQNLEKKVKESKESNLLLTLTDKNYYGFVYKDEIYLTKDGINPSVLLHEYAHLWLEVYRLSSDKSEWDKLKNDVLSSGAFQEQSKNYDSDVYTTNDALFTEFVCDYIANRALSSNELSTLCNNTINSTVSNVLETNKWDLFKGTDDKLKNLSSLCIKDLINERDFFRDFEREKLDTFFALKTVYEISQKKEEEMRNGIKSKLTSYSDEKINETITSIKDLVNEAPDDLKTKTAKLAYKWVLDGSLILPEDKGKFKNALAVAEKGHIDPFRYNSPVVLLEENTEVVLKEPPIDPDTVSTLTNKKVYDYGIVVYDVDESDESRENMRKIINTHLGKNSSPWCLLEGDENGELTEYSEYYWNNEYNGTRKQVAFVNGKLSYFSASSTKEIIWWDTQDKSHNYIQIKQKILNDPLDRTGIFDYDLNNNKTLDKPNEIFRKTKNSYTTWYDDLKTIETEKLYEKGILTSSKVWSKTGNLDEHSIFNPITGELEERKEFYTSPNNTTIVIKHILKRFDYELTIEHDLIFKNIRSIYYQSAIDEKNVNDEKINNITIERRQHYYKEDKGTERIVIQTYGEVKHWITGFEVTIDKNSHSSITTCYISGAISNNQNAIVQFFTAYGNLVRQQIKAINPLENVLNVQDFEYLTKEEQKKLAIKERLEELKKADILISLPRNGIEDSDADLEEKIARENGIPIIPYEALERNNFQIIKSLLEVQKQEQISNSQNHKISNSVILHSIDEQISAFKSGNFNRTDTFTLTSLNPLLKNVGYTNYEITLDQTHMRYCLFNSYKGNDDEKANHFTGEEFFDKLPELLNSPIAIIPSNTKGDERQLIILDYKLNGSYVCASVKKDGVGLKNTKKFNSTHIFSICAKEQTEYILQCRIKEEIEHQKYVNKPCGIYYIDNKKATEALIAKGFELPRGFMLNGHINNIPNIKRVVNSKNVKNDEKLKITDLGMKELKLSLDEYALTTTIANLLNNVGINTYVISEDELLRFRDQKIKDTTNNDILIYKTISSYEVYGCTKGKNIYLKEGAIKSDVLLHEYAHLWLETFRLSNSSEWEEIKTSLMSDNEVVDALNKYSSVLSPSSEDGKLVEYICDRIAQDGKNFTFDKILSSDISALFECNTSDELLKKLSECAINDLVNASTVLKNAAIPENITFFDSKDRSLFDDDDDETQEEGQDNSVLEEKLKTDEYIFTPKRDIPLEAILFEGYKIDGEEIVLDYSTVECDKILLANKKTILDKPYPSYLPPLHYGHSIINYKGEKLFKIPATELKDGSYLIRDLYAETDIDENREEHYKVHNIYYKVSLEVYAALKHYNITFFRALEEKRVNDNLKSINNAIDKENALNPTLGLSHLQKRSYSDGDVDYYITYNENVSYDTLPQIKVQSFGRLQFTSTGIFNGLTLKEYQDLISPSTYVNYETIINKEQLFHPHRASCKIANGVLTPKKLIIRKDNHSMNKDTYHTIKNTTKKIYDKELDNYDIFKQWRNLQDKVAYILNDMYYQEDNLMSSFQKGRETSYGDSNTSPALFNDYGVLIKRQNGDVINEKETRELKSALDYTFSLYGNLTPILKENNIKLSHAGNVNQHASKAIGIWYPLYKAIGLSFKDEEQALSTSVHEFAHFLDYVKGQRTHHWHSSTVYGTIENSIANNFRGRTYPPTKYYESTPECFARCMELYATSLKFFKNHNIDTTSIETLKDFEIETLNNKFLEEYPNFNNKEITGDLLTICTKVDDYEPHISLFKVCEQFISSTRKLLNINEYNTATTKRNEQISNSQNHKISNSVILHSSIDEQISAFKSGNFNRTDTFTLTSLNPLLKNVGYTNYEITLDQTHMRYCLFNSYKGNDDEKANHFTGEEFFDKLPELLNSPIAIIPSNTKGDERQLIILDYKLNGSYVCALVRRDGQGMRNNQAFPSTHILSIYAKDTAEYILSKEIGNEIEHQKYVNKPCGIYYIDNKKATEMLNGKGFQLPRSFNLNGHINNIPNIQRVVNSKNIKNDEKLNSSIDTHLNSVKTTPSGVENKNSRQMLQASTKEEIMDDRNTVNGNNRLEERLKENGISENSLLAFIEEHPELFSQIQQFSEKSNENAEKDLTKEGESLNNTNVLFKNETEEHQNVSTRDENNGSLQRGNESGRNGERVDVAQSRRHSSELPIPKVREMPEGRLDQRQADTSWSGEGDRGLSQYEGRTDENLELGRLSDTTENNISRDREIPRTSDILGDGGRSLGSEAFRSEGASDGGVDTREPRGSGDGVVRPIRAGLYGEPDLEENPNIDDANIKAKDALSIRAKIKNILETKTDDEITREDRVILRQYEGVGGLKEENASVEGALSEFYTPTLLVKKMWELVDAYAPNAYTVLEPSCGSGRFLQGKTDDKLFTCYECDKTSSRIARILYPNATINNDYFQSQFLSDSKRTLRKNTVNPLDGFITKGAKKYDLVIGNPPYGEARDVYSAFGLYDLNSTYPKFFINEGLLHLNKGGLLAFVVPSSLLNDLEDYNIQDFEERYINQRQRFNYEQLKGTNNKAFWARILRNNSLVDAYRLPEGIFPSTEIGTDIIILRHESDIHCALIFTDDGNITYRLTEKGETISEQGDFSYKTYMERVKKAMNFFSEHPERVLGDVKTRLNRMNRQEETYVDFKEGETKEDVFNHITPLESERKIRTRRSVAPKFAIDQSTGEVEKEPKKTSPKTIKGPKVHSNSPLSKVMSEDDFLNKYNLNYTKSDKEIWKATQYNGKIDTLKLTAESLSFLKSSNNYIEVEKDEYYLKSLFVIGNIYEKLAENEKRLSNNSIDKDRYEKVKNLLESHLPSPMTMDKIHFSPLTEFANNFKVERDLIVHNYTEGTTSTETKEISLISAFYQWALNTNEEPHYIDHYNYNPATSPIRKEEFYSEKCNINWRDVKRYIDREPITAGISSTDSKEEKELKERRALINREERKRISEKLFDRFLHEGLYENDKAKLEKEYNQIFNAVVEPDYSKIPFFVDGMSTYKGDKEFTLHPIQLRGASFLQSKGSGLLAYDVGVGKTATGIIATVAQLQSERAKRPLIIVPKAVYNKWYEDIRQLFPNIEVNNLNNFSENYLRPFRKGEHGLNIAEGSISLATYEATQNLSFMDSSIENDGLLKEDLEDLLSLAKSGTNREIAKGIQGLNSRYGEAIKVRNESFVFFEECGFDHVTIDEAHNFKNLFAMPRKIRGESNEYEGLTGGKPSQRAIKLYCMTSLIQHQNNDRNVFLLTATPFTNHPFEVFTMLAFMGRKRMKQLQIGSLRAFADKFAETKTDYAVTPQGDVDFKQSMKSWRCLNELQNVLFEYIDRVTAEEAGIIRPEKIVHPVFIQMTELQEKIRDTEGDRIVNSSEKAATLKAIGNNKKSSISPCILKSEDYDFALPEMSEFVESSPKLTVTLDTIASLYKEHPNCGQVLYCDIAVEEFSEMKKYLIAKGINKNAIAQINGQTTDDRRKAITDAFNDEKAPLKILIGSSAIKEGIDLNGNTIALYNVSLGWNPTETVQIEGRIWRQGNKQGKVHIVYPLTEDSVDAFIYQKFEEKSKRIEALWSYKGDSLNTEEINPEEMKFDLIKDPEKKAKLFVNDEKEKLTNSLKLINLEKENYSSLRNLLLKEEKNKADLAYEKTRLKEAKENDMSIYYITERKEEIKRIEKELRTTEKSKEKFGLSTISDVDRVLGEFDEKIARINTQIENLEKEASIKLEQYKKEFEEERLKQRKATPEITASLISSISSNLVRMKTNYIKPKTFEATSVVDLQSDTENITPVIFDNNNSYSSNEKEETSIKTDEKTMTKSSEIVEKLVKNHTSRRKQKVVVDDFYEHTLFDFSQDAVNLLIAENGYFGQEQMGKALIDRMRKANINVVEMSDKERLFLENSLRSHNPSITENDHLYGYEKDNTIYLSPLGINPNTALHEYTHLWGECIKATNPELFERIKAEVMKTDEFKKVMINGIYEGISESEDALCLETLAVLSGKDNTAFLDTRLENKYEKEKLKEENIENALASSWDWTDKNLFAHFSHTLTLSEVTNQILQDAVNSSEVETINEVYKAKNTEVQEIDEGSFDKETALSEGYNELALSLMKQYFSLRPYLKDETKEHYNEWLLTSLKKDKKETVETLIRYIEEETISQKFFKRFIEDYKDESVRNYIESIFEKNDSEDFRAAFDSGFALHSQGLYKDRERNNTYLHFANFLHGEVLNAKNPVAMNCLKQFISENNSPELIRFLMLTVGAKDQNSYENRMLIRSLLPQITVNDEITNASHKRQADFGILDSECFVTNKEYSTLFVGGPLDGKRSKLTIDEKALSLSSEFKNAFSDIETEKVMNDIKKKEAITVSGELSHFEKSRRDKALLKGDYEKCKKIENNIVHRLSILTYTASDRRTSFTIENSESLTETNDKSLKIPVEILSDFDNIVKNASSVRTFINDSDNMETSYITPIKYQGNEYDFAFSLETKEGETVLKQKSISLIVRDKTIHSLVDTKNYIDKETNEPTSEIINTIVNGDTLSNLEAKKYNDALIKERTANRERFEELKSEYSPKKEMDEGMSEIQDFSQKPETTSVDETQEITNAEEDRQNAIIAPLPEITDKEIISDDEEDDREVIPFDDEVDFNFLYKNPDANASPEELKKVFFDEYNRATSEDEHMRILKEREEKQKQWEKEKLEAQEGGRKEAERRYNISKGCSVPVNNQYLINHGLDASIAEKNGVHYSVKYRQLQVPLYSNKDGALCNLQQIYDDGRKYNLKGAEVGHAVIGKDNLSPFIFICEGWATGAAIQKATNGKVYCSMSCINYKRMVDFIKREEGELPFIVAIADRNPPQIGEKYGVGEKYARESGADITIVIPDVGNPEIKDAADFAKEFDLRDFLDTELLKLTDFNLQGKHRTQLTSAKNTMKQTL